MLLFIFFVLKSIFSGLKILLKESSFLLWLFLELNIMTGMVLLSMKLVMFVDQYWLNNKHPWNTNESNKQEEDAKTLLEAITTYDCYSTFINFTTGKCHIDHVSDD